MLLLYKVYLVARLLSFLRGADDNAADPASSSAAHPSPSALFGRADFPWEKLPLDADTYTTTTGIELRRPSEFTYLRSRGYASGGKVPENSQGTRRLAAAADATVQGQDGLDIGTTGNLSVPCESDADCGGAWGGGSCVNASGSGEGGTTAQHCVCGTGWYALSDTAKNTWQTALTDQEQSICGYEQLPRILILMTSIFLGGCGVDRCLLARLDGCSIIVGICKGVTVGACGVWYVIDIIFISLDMLPDARGIPLV